MKISEAKATAKRLGQTRFFTGESCKRGHIAKRNTANGSCIVCAANETRARRLSVVGKIRYVLSCSYSRALKRGHAPIDPLTIHPYPDDKRCELCGKLPKSKSLHADHDHDTGRFRGWICYRCNSMLGNMAQVGEDRIKAYVEHPA
jgi:hypothetical protein